MARLHSRRIPLTCQLLIHHAHRPDHLQFCTEPQAARPFSVPWHPVHRPAGIKRLCRRTPFPSLPGPYTPSRARAPASIVVDVPNKERVGQVNAAPLQRGLEDLVRLHLRGTAPGSSDEDMQHIGSMHAASGKDGQTDGDHCRCRRACTAPPKPPSPACVLAPHGLPLATHVEVAWVGASGHVAVVMVVAVWKVEPAKAAAAQKKNWGTCRTDISAWQSASKCARNTRWPINWPLID